MKKDVMKKWVKALRSGRYKQGAGYLKFHAWSDPNAKMEYEHCCLGVLCEIAREELNIYWEPKSYEDASILKIGKAKKDDCLLPPSVQKWAGMHSKDGKFVTDEGRDSLIDINDSGNNSFKYIANIIQKHWDKL